MQGALSSFSGFVANMLGWTKRTRAIEALEQAERRSYEYASMYWDESTTTPTNPPETLPSPLLPTLTLILRLPRELRDQIYIYILAPTSPTYTIQPPFVYRTATYLPTTPLHFIPPCLSHFWLPTHPAYPNYPTHPAARAVIAELTICLLAQHGFFARYRYDASLVPFLERDWMNRGVVPGEHLRRLSLLVKTPEGPEDGEDDCDREFEWGALFPRPRNARCRGLRERLEGDLGRLAEVLGERCVVEVLVCVWDWEDEEGREGEGQRAMRVWLGGLVERWRGVGRRMVVKIVKASYETRELEF